MLDYDVIVIGSGFGGAVAACRLAEAGYRVVVLERGRRWRRDEYPSTSKTNWRWDNDKPHKANGWFDVRLFKTIATVAGAGVGGGSLHYANVSINAHETVFAHGWPAAIKNGGLASYYPKVKDMLGSQKIPENQLSNRTKLLKEAATSAQIGRYGEVDLAVRFNPAYAYDASKESDSRDTVFEANDQGIEQGFCVHLGQCVLGCPVEARNTLATNYLPQAEKNGATILPLHIVRTIVPEHGGYRVRYDEITGDRLMSGEMTARKVIVACGSIGSTELLLRCRDQYKTLPRLGPMLGRKWSTNANYLTLATHAHRDVYPTRGPTISGAISFLDGYQGSHFFIEDGGFPDAVDEFRHRFAQLGGKARRFRTDLEALKHEPGDELFRHLMLWFAQGQDEPVGAFRLRKRWLGLWGPPELDLAWDREGARQVLDHIKEVHTILLERTNGEIFLQPPHALITPHPLGGCPMGETGKDGVVDHRGEVFGYKHLYVADGSVVPRPIGNNPSKTIAALSERMAAILVSEGDG